MCVKNKLKFILILLIPVKSLEHILLQDPLKYESQLTF